MTLIVHINLSCDILFQLLEYFSEIDNNIILENNTSKKISLESNKINGLPFINLLLHDIGLSGIKLYPPNDTYSFKKMIQFILNSHVSLNKQLSLVKIFIDLFKSHSSCPYLNASS